MLKLKLLYLRERVSVPMRIEHLYSNSNKQHSNQERLTCGRDWINLDPCREVEGRLISSLQKISSHFPLFQIKVVEISPSLEASNNFLWVL